MSTPIPNIAIIGAGPVGLMLAAILHRNGIQAKIFERETSATVRAQGGTLDIHAETGQRALAAAGLLPAFKKISRPEGEATRVVKKDGTVLLDENEQERDPRVGDGEEEEQEEGGGEEGGRGRPEIDRTDLKDLLIAALPQDMIRWGKGISSVTPVPGTQQWKLEFIGSDSTTTSSADDSESGPYDLVLGADGAWSRVRPLLTDAKPLYSGVSALDVWISPAQLAQRPDVAAFIGRGSCMLLSEDRFLSLQRHGDGSARAYAMVRTSREVCGAVPGAETLLGLDRDGGEGDDNDDDAAVVDWTDAKTRERFLDRYFGDYAREARDAVLAMTQQPTLRPLYMLPVGHRWEPRPGVTLLGDAAHVMTPFAGVGVNVGMMDALELAEGIVAYVKRLGEGEGEGGKGDLAEMLRDYENGMFERSRKDAALTARMLEIEFGEGGPEKVVEIMSGGGPSS
ncbi:FAD/NAD(P)-binding domain-containing protein [Daldinia caldariorum]|uniref:FAD/NAD(P)-binding domain-containing protein n=1 Tax=Daldinia caldariorum TaxID=326644 RepID=UPI0020084E04|nr:FAD/NAD(P)-binding domain-containing protein [Daldinia caldariorum]KAI1463398.1 FAD/NAD(P)-binding domain-containing protein [Daldinia caldariorum]